MNAMECVRATRRFSLPSTGNALMCNTCTAVKARDLYAPTPFPCNSNNLTFLLYEIHMSKWGVLGLLDS